MSTLTWRDVAAPDSSSALYGLSNAGKGMQDAFSNLSQGIDRYQKAQEDSANAAGLSRAMQFTNPNDLRAALASGAFNTQGMNAAGVQALNNQVGQQIEQNLNQTRAAAAQHELNNTLQDEDFQKNHPNELAAYSLAMQSGDPNKIASATQQLTSAGARYQLAQNIAKAQAGIGQSEAGIRSSNANVDETNARIGLIGAQKAEIGARTNQINSETSLGKQRADFTVGLSQAIAKDPNMGGYAFVNQAIKDGVDKRVIAPFTQYGEPGSGFGIASNAKRPTTTGSYMDNDPTASNPSNIGLAIAGALTRNTGNNTNASDGALFQKQNSQSSFSDLLPKYAPLNPVFKNNPEQLIDAAKVIQARAKNKGYTVPSNEAAMSIASDAVTGGRSKWLLGGLTNSFSGSKTEDFNNIDKQLASLTTPKGSSTSSAENAFNKSLVDNVRNTQIQQLGSIAQSHADNLRKFSAMYKVNPDPEIRAIIDREQNAYDSSLRALNSFGKTK